jgi:hypothetical protein
VPDGYEVLRLQQRDLDHVMAPPITTQTFFTGNFAEFEACVRGRFRSMVKANPWLAGRAVQSDEGEPMIVYPATVTDEMADKLIQAAPEGLNVSLSMGRLERRQQISEGSANQIPVGPSAVGKTYSEGSQLIWLVMTPCRNKDGSRSDTSTGAPADFAVLFTVSHLASGGPTYYHIFNMLSTEQPIRSLRAPRVMDFYDKVKPMIAQDLLPRLLSGGTGITALLNKLRGRSDRAQIHTFLVDNDRIADIKAAVAARGDKDAAFVSTNDILCSSLLRMTRSRDLYVAVSFIGRIAGIEADLAGNYEAPVVFHRRNCESPVTFRKALQGFVKSFASSDGDDEGLISQPDSWVQSLSPFQSDRLCYITNYSMFREDMVIPGCEEILHMPSGDTEMVAKIFQYDTIVVFRARPGQLGMVAISRDFSKEDYLRGMPLKESSLLS